MYECQDGEQNIILPIIQRPRVVVDVGAADGVEFSNSRFLIRDHGWRGILIEPEPTQFAKLQSLYANNPNVTTIRAACSATEGEADLYPGGTGSTLLKWWVDRGIIPYGAPLKVRTAPLAKLLDEANCPRTIDFLSIDCEGLDFEVIKSMDFRRWHVRMLCIESGADGNQPSPEFQYIRSLGFKYAGRTSCNTFFTECC